MNRKSFVSALAVLAGFVIGSACTKIDTTDIGNDLIPAVDDVHTFDTVLDVITDNLLYPDSTRISTSAQHAIGIIENDPEFGKTEAAAYFSLTPGFFGTHPFVNEDSVEIDSIVLSIPYSSLYGDSNSIQQFEVYQIDPNADFKDSVYEISTPDFPVLPAVLGSKLVDFTTLNDSVHYVNYTSTAATVTDSIGTVNVLRIHLDPSFGQQFLDFDTATDYKSDSAFRSKFKGLALRINDAASPNKSALAYFTLTGDRSAQLIFYSRLTKNGQVDTIAPAFTYGNRAQANLVSRTPSNGYLANLNNGIPSDDILYLQTSPGSVVTIDIPGLENLSNRVIHRAELIVEKIPSAQEDIFTPPAILFIDAVNETGDSTFTIRNDFIPTGTGTGYDLATIEGLLRDDRYTFNISRYVQSIVTEKMPSRTLRIYAPYATWPYFEAGDGSISQLPFFIFVNSPIGSGRVVLGGGTHATQRMRLRIIYSKI